MKPHRILTAAFALALTAIFTLHAEDATAPQSWTATDGQTPSHPVSAPRPRPIRPGFLKSNFLLWGCGKGAGLREGGRS